MKKFSLVTALLTCAVFAFSGCSSAATPGEAQTDTSTEAAGTAAEDGEFNQFDMPKSGDEIVVLNTDMGVIKLRVFPEVAPMAAENFLTHVKDGYYDGVIFHRVISDFVIQTGDPLGNGTGGESIWGSGFEIEVDPRARHFTGALAMARGQATDSNGSQFYIVNSPKLMEEFAAELEEMKGYQDELIDETLGVTIGDLFSIETIDNYLTRGGRPDLDYNYTVFGQVIEGLDIVQQISQVETDDDDKPFSDVKVQSAVVEIYQ